MYRRFRMSFDYRYVINDGAVICFAKPKQADPTISNYRRIAGLLGKTITSPYKEYKGIARLKDGDCSNADIAKDIARDKAYRSALKGFARFNNEFFEMMTNIAMESVDFGKTIEQKIEAVQLEIDELTS